MYSVSETGKDALTMRDTRDKHKDGKLLCYAKKLKKRAKTIGYQSSSHRRNLTSSNSD